MKKIRKGTIFTHNDNIKRKIIDVEKYSNNNYVCYYVDVEFDDGDDFFEKDSPVYNEIVEIINKK
jgi:hypothetical protein